MRHRLAATLADWCLHSLVVACCDAHVTLAFCDTHVTLAHQRSCVQWQHKYCIEAGCTPVLLRDRAGEAALLSLDGALLAGLEGGRVAAGDGPLLILGLPGRAGAALRTGLHSEGPC